MIKELTLTVKKLERQQQLGSHAFTNSGIEKQAEFIRVVGDWVEDSLKIKLEAELGEVPEKLKKVIETVENLLAERFHLFYALPIALDGGPSKSLQLRSWLVQMKKKRS